MKKHAISPTRSENYSGWYQSLVQAAELAENAPVRGCMVIKPWGYGIWEHIQNTLDQMIKQHGHQNIYCPLFIPLSFMEKEAQHVSGFAKECAVVTHTKLEQTSEGKLVPSGPLEEPLIVRPTSETMIGELFAKWIQSYRDLPLLVNQWANIVRWEMRTRVFLRTTEFLWQEGHTAHATANEAEAHAKKMHQVYVDLCENHLAIPVIPGEKSLNEKFPGADTTLTIEAIMQDAKALQLGTSHFLGQNFSKASNMQFQDEAGKPQTPWTTSWGVTTRLVGGLIMSHSDDDGLVLPPKIAPIQIVIIPVLGKHTDHVATQKYCKELAHILQTSSASSSTRVHIDTRHLNSGEKNWSWIKKGVPLRVFIGEKEVESGSVCYCRRVDLPREKTTLAREDFIQSHPLILQAIQDLLFQNASKRVFHDIPLLKDEEAYQMHFKSSHQPAWIYWFEDTALEDRLQSDFGLSIRCYASPHEHIPYAQEDSATFDPQKRGQLALIAKAY